MVEEYASPYVATNPSESILSLGVMNLSTIVEEDISDILEKIVEYLRETNYVGSKSTIH